MQWAVCGSPGGGRVPSRERDRDSSSSSGSRKSRGAGRRQEGRGRGGVGERGSRGVGQREQWKDPSANQSDRENELSQTNRGVGGVCVGVMPRVQSKLSRALHVHRGKKPLHDVQNLESTAMKIAIWYGSGESGRKAPCHL